MFIIKSILNEPEEINIIRDLFRQYSTELNEDLCFQSFAEELKNPLKKYGPPGGSLLLAHWSNEVSGCVALQPLSEKGVCEMKRLYVRPQFRKHGIGNELIKVLLRDAIEKEYKKMVLDTLDRLRPAITLYEAHGFKVTSPYYTNPLPGVVFMEKWLSD